MQEEKHNSKHYSWFSPGEEHTNEYSLENKGDCKHKVNKEEYFESDTRQDILNHNNTDNNNNKEKNKEISDEP